MKNNQTPPTAWPFHGVSYAEYLAIPTESKAHLDNLVMGFVLGAASIKANGTKPPAKAAAKTQQKKAPRLRLVV